MKVDNIRIRISKVVRDTIYLEELEGIYRKHYSDDSINNSTKDYLLDKIDMLTQDTKELMHNIKTAPCNSMEDLFTLLGNEKKALEKMIRCAAGVAVGCTEDVNALDWTVKMRIQSEVISILQILVNNYNKQYPAVSYSANR